MDTRKLDLNKEYGIDFYLEPDLEEKIMCLIIAKKENKISAEDFRFEMQDCIRIARLNNKILPNHSKYLEWLFIYTDNV